MKKWMISVSIFVILCATGIFAQRYLKTMYVGAETENLRAVPQGKKIGAVDRGTELEILEENEKWAKVRVTGWIWKESLSNLKPPRTGIIRASLIVVETEAKASEILAALKAGKDFTELAKTNSTAPTASRGGDLGEFHPDDFNPAFSSVLKDLSVGGISEIVKTSTGYHIFKRTK